MYLEHSSNTHDSQEQLLKYMYRSKLPAATELCNVIMGQKIKKNFQILRFIINKYSAKQSINVCLHNMPKKKSQTNKKERFSLPFWISVYSNNWFKSVQDFTCCQKHCAITWRTEDITRLVINLVCNITGTLVRLTITPPPHPNCFSLLHFLSTHYPFALLLPLSSRISQQWQDWHFSPDNSLLWGAALCTAGSLAVSLVSIH